MTITGSGQFGVAAIAANNSQISKTKDGLATVTAQGLVSPDQFSVVLGETTTSSPPATLAGLANTTVLTVTDVDWQSVQLRLSGSTYTFVGALSGAAAGADSAWTDGHSAWIAIFGSASPASSDAPAFVIGPRTVVS